MLLIDAILVLLIVLVLVDITTTFVSAYYRFNVYVNQENFENDEEEFGNDFD